MDPRGRTILIIGDSLSAAASAPGGVLAAELRRRGAAEVRVDAQVGRSAVNLWTGTNGETGASIAAEANRRPDIAVIFLGTNDAASGVAAAADEAGFRRIVGSFAPGTAWWAVGPPAFPQRPDIEARAVPVYATLARVFGAAQVLDARPLTPAAGRTRDGVHFTRAGAKTFGQAIAAALAPETVTASPMPVIATGGGWRWTIGGAGLALIGIAAAIVIRRRRQLAGPGRTWMSVRGERKVVNEIDTPRGRRLVIHSADDGLPELIDPTELDREIRLDEARASSAARQHAAQAAAASVTAAQADREATMRAFSTNPKVRAALLQVQGFNGKPMPRHAYVEAAVEAGAQVVTTTGGRRLVSANGAFFTERDITKSAMDYATWLRTQRGLGTPRIDDPRDQLDYVRSHTREGEIDDAAERAVAAGAREPLEFMGAGGEGIVFCTGDVAYKAGRRSHRGDQSLATEAEFFRRASQVPQIKRKIARFHRYDAEHDVLVRECVRQRGERKYGRRNLDDAEAWDAVKEIEQAMLPYGYTGPERKSSSFVYVSGRGPVLIDGGFARKVGHQLVKEVLDKRTGRIPRDRFDTDESLAYDIRVERGRTIPKSIADRIRAKLGDERPLAGRRYAAPYSASTPRERLEYAYHVTSLDRLPAIQRDGLKPAPHPHLDEDDEAIFVERDPEGADVYSDRGKTVMLRFLVDGFGSTEDGEDVLYDVAVPPEQIEARTRTGWQPIATARAGLYGRQRRRRRELIPGGLAPGGACPPGVDPRQLRRGIKVEREHTTSAAVAREIACDHLTEDPRYYTKLATIE